MVLLIIAIIFTLIVSYQLSCRLNHQDNMIKELHKINTEKIQHINSELFSIEYVINYKSNIRINLTRIIDKDIDILNEGILNINEKILKLLVYRINNKREDYPKYVKYKKSFDYD